MERRPEIREGAKMIIAGVLLALGGAWFWCYAMGNPLDEFALIRRAQSATGHLVDILEVEQEDGRGRVFLSDEGIYSYRISDGREFRTSTEAPTGKLEERETVEYLSDDPAISRIKGDGCQSVGEWMWRKVGLGAVVLAMLLAPGIICLRDGLRSIKAIGIRGRANGPPTQWTRERNACSDQEDRLARFLRRRPHFPLAVVAAAMLMVAIADLPYQYYRILRWVVCAAAIFVAYEGWAWKRIWVLCVFVAVALLFNPLMPVHLDRGTWRLLDCLVALLFIGIAVTLWRPEMPGDTFWLRVKLMSKGMDPFFLGIRAEQIALYQHYLAEMLTSVDIDNLTDRSQGKSYDRTSYDTDYQRLDAVLERASREGLNKHYLQVIFEQYVYADVHNRAWHTSDWVKTAMRWQRYDFIHDPAVISRDFFVANEGPDS